MDRPCSGHQREDEEGPTKASSACPPTGVVDDRLQPLRGGDLAAGGLCCAGHGTSITSTMFEVKVDRNEAGELHEQIAAEIRRGIALGEAVPGDRLPPAKDLAAVAGVNKNTVLRALRTLRDEGLLEFQRGRGVRVSGTTAQGAVIERARELVQFAREQGYRREDLVKLIKGLS